MYLLGSDEYIQHIVEQYSQLLLRIAFTRLNSTSDAEDVVQEVFLKLLTKSPRFKNEEHEKAWLIRTTINLSTDILKAKSRQNVPLDDNIASTQNEVPQLLHAVKSLPGKYSIVLHLYCYEGYSIKEIAKILSLPAGTVGTRLARARTKLKLILEKEAN